MSLQHKRQTLESMMLYHCRNSTGVDRLQTMLSEKDLREMGLQSFQGKWTHQVTYDGGCKTFEIVPRVGK